MQKAGFLQGVTGRQVLGVKRYCLLRERVIRSVAGYGNSDTLSAWHSASIVQLRDFVPNVNVCSSQTIHFLHKQYKHLESTMHFILFFVWFSCQLYSLYCSHLWHYSFILSIVLSSDHYPFFIWYNFLLTFNMNNCQFYFFYCTDCSS